MYLTFKLNFSDLVFFSFLTVCDVASWLENFFRAISSRECHPLNNRNNVYSSTDPRVKTYGVIFCDQFHIIPIWTYLLMTVKPPIFKSSVPQPFGNVCVLAFTSGLAVHLSLTNYWLSMTPSPCRFLVPPIVAFKFYSCYQNWDVQSQPISRGYTNLPTTTTIKRLTDIRHYVNY